jgi:lipid-binding SYLF domain-containing protein
MIAQLRRLTILGLLISAPLSDCMAASAVAINNGAHATFASFAQQVAGARELANKAAGILVFPSVMKAGFGFGGSYGEGLLVVHRKIAGYYKLSSASLGLQIGAQQRSVIIIFMTDDALARFLRNAGWRLGVDGAVVLLTVGMAASIDTDKLTSPIIGFDIDQRGLMGSLAIEGSKITRISR